MKKLVIVAALLAALPVSSFAEEKDMLEVALGSRVTECKNHFDIEPYFVLAVGGDHDERITAEVVTNFQNFVETGRLNLPANKKSDPKALRCATFAEGMLVGGFGNQFLSAFGKVMGEVMGKAIESMAEGISGSNQAPKK